MSIFSIVAKIDDFESNTEWDYLPGLKTAWYNYTDRAVKLVLIAGNNLSTSSPVTWIAFGNAGLVATSTDGGETWTDKTANLTSSAWGTSNIILGTDTYNGGGVGQFIIVNDAGLIATTSNFGTTWVTIDYITNSGYRVNWNLLSTELLKVAVRLSATYPVLNEIPAGQSFKRGDLNLSGSITSADALRALRIEEGLLNPEPYTNTYLVSHLLANQSTYPDYLLPSGWYSDAPEIVATPELNKSVSSIKFIKETNQIILGGSYGQIAVIPVNSTTKLAAWTSVQYYYPKVSFDRGQAELTPFRYQPITSIAYSNINDTNYYIFGTTYGNIWITTTLSSSSPEWFLYTFIENEDLNLRKTFNQYEYQRYLYLNDKDYFAKEAVTDIIPIKLGVNTYISYLFKYKDDYILRVLIPDKKFLKLNSVYKRLESFIDIPTKISNIDNEPSLYLMDVSKKLLITTSIFTELKNVLDINIQSYYDDTFTENLEIDSAHEEKSWPNTTKIGNFSVIPFIVDAGGGVQNTNYIAIANGEGIVTQDNTGQTIIAGGGELQKRLLVTKSNLTSFNIQKSPYLINSFAFDNSPLKAVIVGDNGLIEYSTNIETWSYSDTGTKTYNLNKVLWLETPGKFIAVGTSGTIISSTDGITWVKVTSPTPNNLNNIVQIDATTLIAVGDGGTLIKSTDSGTTWSLKTNWTTYNLNSISYSSSQNKIVVVGASGRTGYSSDLGETWTANSVITGSVSLNDIANNGTNWVVAGNEGRIYTSTNGVSWTETIIENVRYYRVQYLNSRFIVVGFRGRVYESTNNGVNWTGRSLNVGNDLVDFTFYNSKYYFYTANKTVYSNNTTWTGLIQEPYVQGNSIVKMEQQPGTNNFYFAGAYTKVWRSQDNGSTWSIINDLSSSVDLVYDSADQSLLLIFGKFIYKVLLSTLVRTNSTTTLSSSLTNNFNSITKFTSTALPYSYIATTNSNEIATNTSTSVSSWTKATLSITGKLNKVIYNSPSSGTDLLIGIGTNSANTRGVIFKSTNGTTWTEDISYEGLVFNDIIYTGDPEKAYVVVGDSGVILYSRNATNWIPVNKFTNFNIKAIKVLSGGIIMVVGASGFIATTTNLKNWTVVDSKVPTANLNTIGYNSTAGKIVIGGETSGVILTN